MKAGSLTLELDSAAAWADRRSLRQTFHRRHVPTRDEKLARFPRRSDYRRRHRRPARAQRSRARPARAHQCAAKRSATPARDPTSPYSSLRSEACSDHRSDLPGTADRMQRNTQRVKRDGPRRTVDARSGCHFLPRSTATRLSSTGEQRSKEPSAPNWMATELCSHVGRVVPRLQLVNF
jgi:hypothetical protein